MLGNLPNISRDNTLEVKEEKSSAGSTDSLNCPFLLSKRRRMVLEGGMAESLWKLK